MPRDGSDQTPWRDVYYMLRRDIDRGALPPGSGLPTIAQLAKQHGLTAHGARRVYDRLRSEGRAQSWQGRGVRVAMRPLHITISHNRPTFHEYVAAEGRQSSSGLVETKSVRLSAALADRMQCKPGKSAIATETLRRIDGQVVALSTDFFPSDRLDGIAETIRETQSISEALAQHGVRRYHRDYTSIQARLPTAHEALLLGIPRSQPVYATIGANMAPGGQVVQVSTALWRADCIRFEY